MADAILSVVLTELVSILKQQVEQELDLVLGVESEIENLTNTFTSIRAVLADAERRQVTGHDDESQSIKLWLQRLQDAAYDTDDVLSEWRNELLKYEVEKGTQGSSSSKRKVVCFLVNFPCTCFGRVMLRRDIAIKIQELNRRLDVIDRDKERYSFIASSNVNGNGGRQRVTPRATSYVDNKVCGRDGDKATLVAELLKEGSSCDTISVVGMGGIGKTTLAGLVYHSEDAINTFQQRVFICVSEPPFDDELRVAKAIVEQLDGNAPNLFELEAVLARLRRGVEGKRFLFVLDDIWTDGNQKWQSLRNSLLNCGAPGSKVLVTTRNRRVAQVMDSSYILPLEALSENDCWLLFSQIAFQEKNDKEKEQLEHYGRKIAEKCKGLPLAANIMGNFMRFKTSVEEWRNVSESDVWEKEASEGIFTPLLLSYHDLPSPIKNCFLYCANFPQDYEIEAGNLIRLWMAHDYLSFDERNVDMETTGKEYLDILITRSFFQLRKEKDKRRDNVTRFKMHDMVLQSAQSLRKGESLVREAKSGLAPPNNSSVVKARHLTLMRSEDSSFPEFIGNMESLESLHSFWVQSCYDSSPIVSQVDKISPELFQHLVHLKSLDLSRNRLRELPTEIEKLQNLRYLNLSHNPIWELPETLCVLYRLQSLNLNACKHLSRLPENISKLMNLRHLEIDRTDSLSTLPKRIGELSSLRTLSKFVLTGSSTDSCTIGDLGRLNHLRGSIKIKGLGYVVSAGDAAKAVLRMKKHLTDVHMDFRPQSQGSAEDIAEALKLHPDLQTLCISFYHGACLPGWLALLTSLRKLDLQDCINCTSLPPLGTLPSLENLYLKNMHGLKSLGDGALASSTITDGFIMFPELKKLKFSNLSSWEEWKTTTGENMMPKIEYLKVSGCRMVRELPDSLVSKSSLKKLNINDCPLLHQQYNRETGDHWKKISHIPKVQIH